LDRVLVGEEVDDLEGVLDNADGQRLLAGVAALAHEADGEALDDGALGLAEALGLVAAGRVRHEGVVAELLLERQIVLERNVAHDHVLKGPLAKQLDFGQCVCGCRHFGGKTGKRVAVVRAKNIKNFF
jgi:hypothetical protein